MTPKIRLQNISKRFAVGSNVVPAVENVNLSLNSGDFVTLVGPSGCGKSTLFNILVGLLAPDSGGELHIDGKLVAADHLLGRVAFMPQRDMLMPWRTVLDNAILAAEIDGVPRAAARKRALDSLDRFGLRGFENHHPAQLSGGMRQRVALMRTFMFDRDVMLLDEPFGALDALTRAMMQRWLLEVWEGAKRTVLFITHDIDEAIFLGDRVLVMSARPGHIKMELPVPLPRPRAPDIITSAPFVELKRTLLAAVEDESRKAFAAMNREILPDPADA
ncbi:MAG: ABC transporter ATP-binding protein [Betaproteobacteria bacterium]|nr:ABC transporter ATP-binding protein [Betaproteobacteria bacterium]MBK9605741.1 ABC transporter ATP-binding protein [Betaproteobacteria bacterium]